MKYLVGSTFLLLQALLGAAQDQDLAYPCEEIPSRLKSRRYYNGTVEGTYVNGDCTYDIFAQPNSTFWIGTDPWDNNPFGFDLAAEQPSNYTQISAPNERIQRLRFYTFNIACKKNEGGCGYRDTGPVYNLNTSMARIDRIQLGGNPGYDIFLDQESFIGNVTSEFPLWEVQPFKADISSQNVGCSYDSTGEKVWDSTTNFTVSIRFTNDVAIAAFSWTFGDENARFTFKGSQVTEPYLYNDPVQLDTSDPMKPRFTYANGTEATPGLCYTDLVSTEKSTASQIVPSIYYIAAPAFGAIVAMMLR